MISISQFYEEERTVDQLLFWLIFAPIFGFAMYWMYHHGYAVSKSIMAAVFVFDPGPDGDRATVDRCTGWVSHAGRFRESRIYEFVLDARLTQGDVEVLLLNQKKVPLLKLSQRCPAAAATLYADEQYLLRWEFSSAAGECELRW